MHRITYIIKKLSFGAVAIVIGSFSLFFAGSTAFADTPTACVPPADATYGAGVHHPVGADAGTFTYSCATDTWSNAHYTYYPKSNTRKANYPPGYAFDCATGVWTMNEWDYSSSDGAYHLNRVPAPDPGIATGCPVAATPQTDPSGGTSPTGTSGSTKSSTAVENTGPGSGNSTANNATVNSTTMNNNGVTMGNTLFSNASTGNTFVIGNTTGGSAASGAATSVANVANLLQSTSNAFGPNTTVFTANINGDVTGDFMFDPSAILASGPGSTNSATNNLAINSKNTNNTNAAINNNIDVGATSGNATVADNKTGGNATSGNAQAVVNLMNLINTTVAAGKSFIGTININGNLNGDILLPQGVIDALLASTGPGSSNVTNSNLTDNSTLANNTSETANNNITASAITGNASVEGNTNAGTATSGNANTGVTLLNLTGSNTIGKDDLLVFVNVLGKWVGMIMNAPAGTNAAELGGGITASGPSSSNVLASNVMNNSSTTNNANLSITNDVDVHAKSGDANVTNNTNAGNARSGNAATAVNILNLMGSNLSLSDWFGVLFINVFGIWNGSFGINTSAGNPVMATAQNPVQAATQNAALANFKHFAAFVAHGPAGVSHQAGSSSYTANASPNNAINGILGSATTISKKLASTSAQTPSPTPDNSTHPSYALPIAGACLAGIILLVSERDRIFGKRG